MSTSLSRARCPGIDCGKSVFKATMRPILGIFYCVECFLRAQIKLRRGDTGQRDRERQRREMREEAMGVKYGSADHVTVQGKKAVITADPIEQEEAEKLASPKTRKKAQASSTRAVVTDKDHRRTDEDHIPGD